MDILDRLAKSKFRSRFKLRAKELEYIKDKGLDKICSHACDFIRDRVASVDPANDGKQTPMRGHPVLSLNTQLPPVAAAALKNGITSPKAEN